MQLAYFQEYQFPLFDSLSSFIQSTFGFYVSWILLHNICAVIYVQYCVGYDWYSILLSPFKVSTPFCQGLHWVVNVAINQITAMWIALGSWFSVKLLMGRKIE